MYFVEAFESISWFELAAYSLAALTLFVLGFATCYLLLRRSKNQQEANARQLFEFIDRCRERLGHSPWNWPKYQGNELTIQEALKAIHQALAPTNEPVLRTARTSHEITWGQDPADPKKVVFGGEKPTVHNELTADEVPGTEPQISTRMDVSADSAVEFIDDQPEPTLAEILVTFYSEATYDRALRNRLWQDFEVIAIENAKALDQRIGQSDEPEFHAAESGSLYAIRDTANQNFLVIPKFDITIKRTNYETTMKFVFECRNFNDAESFSNIRVARPAVFSRDGERWIRQSKGELELFV